MNHKAIITKLLYLGVIGTGIFTLFFVITCSWIGYEVKRQCADAKREYAKTNCVKALTLLLNDTNQGLRTRNSAVWSLGQLGDRRALPVLESYYTGIIPDRESLDKTISQYELKKAINLVNSGINISALIWRISLSPI